MFNLQSAKQNHSKNNDPISLNIQQSDPSLAILEESSKIINDQAKKVFAFSSKDMAFVANMSKQIEKAIKKNSHFEVLRAPLQEYTDKSAQISDTLENSMSEIVRRYMDFIKKMHSHYVEEISPSSADDFISNSEDLLHKFVEELNTKYNEAESNISETRKKLVEKVETIGNTHNLNNFKLKSIIRTIKKY
ncbi:MAG: hypothetical protein IJZ00_03155 [Lachnospiraceae bacterium]|nr:hypothetical protein [Lachnospiraceae bacterium]